ncbi:MAG: sarcosine oxidase subunit alpha family protein [Pseudomonadota bacterium]
MSGFRLAKGGAIDRNRPLSFTFNGKFYQGFEGDTLASALIASGVDIVGRSFKYHRPRGFVGAGVEEPNGLVQVGTGARSTPNIKATTIALYEGLTATSVNAWPSVEFDIGALNDVMKRFIPAGFYYKTFMWPDWHLFEPLIRRAAGLGQAPIEADADRYDHAHIHCDILIVGGGPAGIAAALTAAQGGLDVVIADDGPRLGGSLLWDFADQTDDGVAFAKMAVTKLGDTDSITVLTDTSVYGYYDHNFLTARQYRKPPGASANGTANSGNTAERIWKIRAEHVILATGAIERPLVFANNDRPGVMLAAAAQNYAMQYGVAAGRRAVLFANNDHAYKSAIALKSVGVDVALVVDPRQNPDGYWPKRAREMGIVVERGAVICDVHGEKRVRAVTIGKASDNDEAPEVTQTVTCDLVLSSGGWSPRAHLFAQSGGKLRYDEAIHSFRPDISVQKETSVGACNGALRVADCLVEGSAAAIEACAILGKSVTAPIFGYSPETPVTQPQAPYFRAPSPKGRKAWVDFQNDVTASDIELAARENYVSVEHLKRYTTLGMASDQGKISNLNGFSIMAQTRGVSVRDVGTTKFRPPYEPVTFGAIAGRRIGDFYHPIRRLPTDQLQRELNAQFEDYGGWARPYCYIRDGEKKEDAVYREVRAVRSGVGLFEASPLGKIEVTGADAGVFLDRIFVNTASTLKPGKARYGLMADENGVVFDDGVFVRLSDDLFLCSTTSAGADHMFLWMEEWLQCEWTDLDVYIANVTTSWATFAVAGPYARDVLLKVTEGVELGNDAFPHMACRAGTVAGVRTRINRISFSGELAYEVNVPAGYGEHVWRAIMEAGAEFDITPYGLEATMLMRAEKGYLHVGADTDGQTLPQDIGYGGPVKKKKSDFIGRRSMVRPDAKRSDRLQFVGLKPIDGTQALPIGGHIVEETQGTRKSAGYITSSYWSPVLQHGIALGLVKSGRDRMGEHVRIYDDGSFRSAEIVSPVFYDQNGDRLAS